MIMTEIPPLPVSLLHRVSSIVASERSLDEMLGGEIATTYIVRADSGSDLVGMRGTPADEVGTLANKLFEALYLGSAALYATAAST